MLVEPSDNIGARAPGDGTHILRALVEGGVPDAGVVINDPGAVGTLGDARPGERHEVVIGGKSGEKGVEPLPLEVEVVRYTDGRFELEDLRSNLTVRDDRYVEMGPCVLTAGCAKVDPGGNYPA